MRTLACLVAAGLFAVSAPIAGAGEVAYGEAYDTLYSVDLDSHTATEIGAAGTYGGQPIANLSGLSFSPDNNVLYAAAGGLNALTRIDPATGHAAPVGSFGLAGQGDPQRNDALDLSMTFDCDGTLWLASAYANKLWTVNPTNGATTLVGSTGHTLTGIIVHGNVMFGAGGRGDNGFYRVDMQTGAATQIGTFGDDRWINTVSMSFDDAGTLWAAINYVPPAPGQTTLADWSDLARIDTSTGEITFIGPITGPDSLLHIGMKGFAIGPPRCTQGAVSATPAPVGTPPWLIALAALIAIAAGASLRRREIR
jgi:hypothetical protein